MKASPHLVAEIQKLEAQINHQAKKLDAKAEYLTKYESEMAQGVASHQGAQGLEQNLQRNMGNYMVPGNVGDINKVTWPFMFSTQLSTIVSPGSNVRSSFSVTQEAAFIMMGYTKSVYIFDDSIVPNEYIYIDPDDETAGFAPGLSYTIRDAVSAREFFNIPQTIDQVGNPRFPSTLPTPQIFLPNSTVEVNYFNSHPSNTYRVVMSFFGQRIRFEGSKRILSTIYG